MLVREEREEMMGGSGEDNSRWRKGAVIVEGTIMADQLVGGEWEEGWGRKDEDVNVEEKMEEKRSEEDEGEENKRWDGGYLRGWMAREEEEEEGKTEEEQQQREEEQLRKEEEQMRREEEEEHREEDVGETEVEVHAETIPPLPPKRRRRGAYENSAVSIDGSRCISSEEVRMEEFDRSSTNVSLRQPLSGSAQMNGIFSPQSFAEVSLTSPDPEYASPSREVAPPVAPRRTRSLSRRGREKEELSSNASRTSLSVPARPQRKTKTTEFFTVPRQKVKPPERPARSGYATPGPSRIPRRRRASTPLPPSIPPSEEAACDSGEDGERVRELTAGEVVSKMRGRPLPPPPRPPRRDRTRSADRSAWEEVVEGHLALGSDRGPGSMTSGRSLSDTGKPPEEVSIAIQTDPLPYEYCVEERAVEDSSAPQQAERQSSEWTGRTSPSTWPTPPPTPPPVAARRNTAQRRQQAAARRAQASSQEAIPQERPPDVAEIGSRVTESILTSLPTEITPPTSPPRERRVPPTPPPVSEVPVTPPEIPPQETPPSIPPLPSVIPPRDRPPTPAESQPPPSPTPPLSVPSHPFESESTIPPHFPIVQEKAPTQAEAPPTEVRTTIEAQKEAPPSPRVVHIQLSQPKEPPAPVAPPRPPKPVRHEEPSKPTVQSTPLTSPTAEPTSVEGTQPSSVPPPSFAQLRSPVTEEQPSYPYSVPPPSFFPPPTASVDAQGRPMPPSPPMGAVALLCVGEISARKLVVSEFQGGWGPQNSPDPPPEPRRPSGRGSDYGPRRRMPSVPTVRRRTMRRTHSEGGGGKDIKDGAEDPDDPELPGIGELSGRLARACGNAAVSTVRQLLLSAVERVEGDGRTEAAIVIALVMAVALVMLTMGHGRQGHRWDFYLPPPN